MMDRRTGDSLVGEVNFGLDSNGKSDPLSVESENRKKEQ